MDPGWQGRGFGAALLRHALAMCDAEHLPAYPEATNERVLSLDERHGFETVGLIQVDGSPPLWPMLRPAR